MPNHINESIFNDSEGLIYPSHEEWSHANQYFAEHSSALKLSRKRQGQGKVRMSFWNLNGVVYAATHPSGENIERCFIINSNTWKSTLKLVVRQNGTGENLTLQDRLKVLKIRLISMGKPKKMTVHNFKSKLEQDIFQARARYLDDFKKSSDLDLLVYPNDDDNINNFVRSTTIAAHGLSDVIAGYEDKAVLDTENYHYALKNYMLLQRYEKDLYTVITTEVLGLCEKLILAVQIALQLHYLHSGIMSSSSKRYAHLDFHTKNIMLDYHGGIRLIDFEHSKAFTDETLTSDDYCDLNVCATDYLSNSDSDNSHLIHRDIFSLLRIINMPYCDSLSLFSHKDLINIFGYNIFYDYLTTEDGYLKPQQHTSALIVAARLLFHGYFKPGSFLVKSVKNHSTIHDGESDVHIQKLKLTKTHVTNQLLVGALDSAYKYTNDVVKKLFIRTLKRVLNEQKDINDDFLRNTLLIITRILSHHRCLLKGRATMQLGITSAPTAYLKAEDSLKEAAELLGCTDDVKHCLYADSDEWGTKLTSDQSGNLRNMSYSFFSAKYTQQQRSSTSKGFGTFSGP